MPLAVSCEVAIDGVLGVNRCLAEGHAVLVVAQNPESVRALVSCLDCYMQEELVRVGNDISAEKVCRHPLARIAHI